MVLRILYLVWLYVLLKAKTPRFSTSLVRIFKYPKEYTYFFTYI